MKERTDYKIVIICVIVCQVIWGFLPIYWQAIKPIDSWIIILYRILTMALYSLIAARLKYSFREIFEPLKDRGTRVKYFTAGLILTANWSIYFGHVPMIALGLALTWATYSAIKKTAQQPPILSMVYETMVYGVLAGAALIYIETKGIGALSYNLPGKHAIMMLAGLLTLIPIWLFAISAKKVSLLVIGLEQYISPTITLLCGIFLFKEEIDMVQLIAFGIIWIGLMFFTYGEAKNSKNLLK